MEENNQIKSIYSELGLNSLNLFQFFRLLNHKYYSFAKMVHLVIRTRN